jgi:cell division transport system permease protein
MRFTRDNRSNKLGSFPIANVIFSTMLALLVTGLFGLLLIHASELTKTVQENVTFQVFLHKNLTEDKKIKLDQFLNHQPYVLRKHGIAQLLFISKEEAAATFIKETGEDFMDILQENPLRDSYIFHVSHRFQDAAMLRNIQKELSALNEVFEVAYLENMVETIHNNMQQISIVLLCVMFILLGIVIILINNTIKLAMYSQRFLIKSMHLVGATASFIRYPFLLRAIMIGLLAGTVADVVLLSLLHYANLKVSALPTLQEPIKILIVLGMTPLLGACITLLGTYKAVNKYLYLSFEHLY